MNERIQELANRWDKQAEQTLEKATQCTSRSLRYFYAGSALSLTICAEELRKEGEQ
jgi:hypothetical protein